MRTGIGNNQTVGRPGWVGYAVALLMQIALSVILRALYPYIPFADFPAPYAAVILLTAWAFGEGPAVLALLVSFLAFFYLFVPPAGFALPRDAHGWAMVLAYFTVTGTALLALVLLRRRNLQLERQAAQLQAANEVLRATTEELTDEIHARTQAEEQLRSVALFSEEDPNPVMRIGGDGQVLYANGPAQWLLSDEGWKPDGLTPQAIRKLVEEVLGSGRAGEIELVHSEGRIFSLSCVPLANKGYANLYGRDFTALRRAEEREREREVHKREFYRRTISAATGGKLVVTDEEEIDRICGPVLGQWDFHDGYGYSLVRKEAAALARAEGLDATGILRLLTCIGESSNNAIKHADSAIARLCRTAEALIFVVSDTGSGIEELSLPHVALVRGYSTAGTLGMGYKLMVSSADRIYLATSPEGTTVASEIRFHPERVTASV